MEPLTSSVWHSWDETVQIPSTYANVALPPLPLDHVEIPLMGTGQSVRLSTSFDPLTGSYRSGAWSGRGLNRFDMKPFGLQPQLPGFAGAPFGGLGAVEEGELAQQD